MAWAHTAAIPFALPVRATRAQDAPRWGATHDTDTILCLSSRAVALMWGRMVSARAHTEEATPPHIPRIWIRSVMREGTMCIVREEEPGHTCRPAVVPALRRWVMALGPDRGPGLSM